MIEALNFENPGKLILVTLWLVVVFRNLACVGFGGYRWKEGLWGNVILAFNFLFATLISINYWEPLARMLTSYAKGGLFFWDSLAFAALFLFSFVFFIVITDKISRIRVAFPDKVENFGNGLVLAFILLFQFLPLYFFFAHLAPVAPVPAIMAEEVKNEDSTVSQGLMFAENFFLNPYQFISSGSLAPMKEPVVFDANRDFFARQFGRRCFMFKQLWEKGKSAYEGEKTDW